MTAKDTREYFECGCLCILTKRMTANITESDEAAAERYMKSCKCSRGVNIYDTEYDNILRAEYRQTLDNPQNNH